MKIKLFGDFSLYGGSAEQVGHDLSAVKVVSLIIVLVPGYCIGMVVSNLMVIIFNMNPNEEVIAIKIYP